MKKVASVLVAFIILASCMLTGCTSSDPFESSLIINCARVYGVRELSEGANANSAINSFSNKREPSSFYSSQDKAEAQNLYDNYVNKNKYYPTAYGLNAATVVAVKDVIVTLSYDSTCCVLYFDEKSDAKSYYDAYVSAMKSDWTNKTGNKNGYAYAISYDLTANRAGNCDYLIGVYLRGNSILLIRGFSPCEKPDTFCDVIFYKIGVIDPNTLKDKK